MSAAIEPDRRVTFETTRGAFVLPARLFEDGREAELAYRFASSMPEGAKSAGRTIDGDGNVTVRWRKIRVIELGASGHGNGPEGTGRLGAVRFRG